MKRLLVTGGSGFLGAWIIRRLHALGVQARVFDVHERRAAVAAIVGDAAHTLDWRVGDICRADDVRAALQGCDGVIHLAGVLTPDCSRDPARGAEINLLGSLHVFEAARAQGLSQVVYASTAGVYGPDDAQHPQPATHYGAFKLAVEGSARAYWNDHRLASVGFRPFVVYGPGRETGVSAGPSLACRAAARGEPYTAGYTGAAGLVYVEDVAHIMAHAALSPQQGAHVFNLVGEVATVEQVLDTLRQRVPHAQLDAAGPPLTIAAGVTADGLAEWMPGYPQTPLGEGLAATLAHYQAQVRAQFPAGTQAKPVRPLDLPSA